MKLPQPSKEEAVAADTIAGPVPLPSSSSSIDWSQVKLSSDGLDEQVDYKARDSMWFDMKSRQIHLYGAAEVKYQTMTITAAYIRIDWEDNM
ncbi:MAG: hypothetical protein ACE5FF_07005, partial [Saprospiraceae bacterium]